MEEHDTMNLLNEQLKVIQNSKAYAKKQLEKTTDPKTKEKIQNYIKGLNHEEKQTLKELNR